MVPKEEGGTTSKAWMDMCDLAHDVFDVYFTTDDVCTDSSKVKQHNKKRLHTTINGTMPYFTAYLKKMRLPKWMVNILLFTEASFRGIAQVS